MSERQGSNFTAGGGKKLGIIRYGREEMTQHERIAADDIFPGEAVEAAVDGEGRSVFQHHSGAADNNVYVAIEARGRGMDAQTDTGYPAGEGYVIAVRASGGGLNLRLADGQNATEGDTLTVDDTGTGLFQVAGAGVAFAEADEDLDLSGEDEPALINGEVS